MAFNIERFDPVSDSIRLLELQRLMALPRNGRATSHLIGGQVTLAEVSKSGVKTRVIHRWPEDQIGQRIEPKRSAKPANVTLIGPRLNRKQRRAMAANKEVA
ncbi:hypothetical protein U0C82_16085 [Fulvimarina sp. 2208YS6-2-32]|uniref:Uncharacterized protein n=1 Tax=Fulvimarina uroteuthidis TaxID=3098149 RepID=A0ABU5I779_9HYPH|nr:hypothetical protein [Fulvimarina sp. 2208YS6-2-32]MDY8110663.1 hypothetical protein [Fulvimarina sp. 2208YS6-2-32]